MRIKKAEPAGRLKIQAPLRDLKRGLCPNLRLHQQLSTRFLTTNFQVKQEIRILQKH